MAQESVSGVQFVDDFYFSAISNNDEDEVYPISDEKYAEELQLQEALMGSVMVSHVPNTTILMPLTIQEPGSSSSNPEPEREVGESSHCFCEICVEKKETGEMFRIDSCSHSFCSDCIVKHVSLKIQENIKVVMCPGLDCEGVVELDACRPRMSTEVVERWDEVLCESMIPQSEKFYCPFKDCSAMLVNDSSSDGDGEGVRQSECPICHRLFCAQCYVPWHAGIECEAFQRLNEDERGKEDLLVRELAKSNSWMRCPHCRYYVEKTDGCLHMNCRLTFSFASIF